MIALRSPSIFGAVVVLIVAGAVACQPAERTAEDAVAPDTAADTATEPPVIEVITTEHAFTAPPSIPSGWVTLRLVNEGEEPHFVVLWQLPENRTFDDYTSEVIPPFVELVEQYRSDAIDRVGLLNELGARLPEWFFTDVRGMGGVGLTAPGRSAQATVNLEPGDYVMECYVETPDEGFHGLLGMLRPLVVTEEPTGAPAPEADYRITLSNYELVTEGELGPGEHTVRVDVTDKPEGLVGHDVHLARLEEDTNLDEVIAWMDWVDALESPAPAEFIGGAEQVPPGHTIYFEVNLEPGRYAWISEGYATRGMVEEFTIE